MKFILLALLVCSAFANNESTIWNFLIIKIGNRNGVAGLMGNLNAESGLIPNNLENRCNSKLGLSDDQYTKRVDSRTYTNFVRDGCGYGLAQWTYYSRKQDLLNYKNQRGGSIGDINLQLEFLWQELTRSFPSVVSTLKNAKSVCEASNAVLLKFERPANMGTSVKTKRCNMGKEFLGRH